MLFPGADHVSHFTISSVACVELKPHGFLSVQFGGFFGVALVQFTVRQSCW